MVGNEASRLEAKFRRHFVRGGDNDFSQSQYAAAITAGGLQPTPYHYWWVAA